MNSMKVLVVAVLVGIGFLPSYGLAIEVSTVSQLKNAVQSANSDGDKSIVLSPGTYLLGGAYFRLMKNHISITGKTGNRSDVILDGQYITTEIFQVLASNITIKDLTLKRAYYHPIHVYPNGSDVEGTVIENVHIIDPGQQAIKINQNSSKTHSANTGTVKRSRIELTASGREEVVRINGSCYTGGVDGHHATGWRIIDNIIVGFWCPTGLSEHGVHFWSESRDTLVVRNTIINCDRGIGFGLGGSGHIGGIIRNNMIYHDTGHAYSDVGIGLENAAGAKVYNNTIFHEHSYPNAIEYRFYGTSGGEIHNNLSNKNIVSRDGGSSTLSYNVTTAESAWFKDPSLGDLHLSYRVAGVVDSGTYLSDVLHDFDGEQRAMGGRFDIGADEWVAGGTGMAPITPWLHILLN